MIAILWTYELRPGAVEAFERCYGPNGDWAALFARGDGYGGTQLLRGPGNAYLTIDRWRSERDFDAFMAAAGADYEALDRASEHLTLAERRLGSWEEIPPA